MGATAGSGVPFGVFAVHEPALHHCVEAQSVSSVHVLPHAPDVTLQIVPAWLPVQSPLLVHFVHAPLAAQYGLPAVGHANVAPVPLSPLHAVHVLAVVLQSGVTPTHAVAFVPVHCTQVLVVVLHAGVTPEQFASPLQRSHLPVFGPVVAQMIERHTTPPFAPVHGPSPFA